MTASSSRFQAVIAEIDAANAIDPRLDMVDGRSRPREAVYSERMSECLSRLYPDASEELRIAAAAQHMGRWQFPRSGFPLGRDGYNTWRTACREYHAASAAAIMCRHGYTDAQIAHVARMIKKQDLKRDADSQALENVAAVVFVQYYLEDFVAEHLDYTDVKLIGILKKTGTKMDAVGRAAVLALPLPPGVKRAVESAWA